jgi:universal stress protein E
MDLSTPSEAALVYALRLARTSGATVHVCHVIPILHVLNLLYEHGFEQPESVKRIAQKARQRIKPIVASTNTGGATVRIQVHCSEADAVQGVLEWAAKLKPDLIVMGTHGRRGAKRFFMGSAAEAVVRRATCPVLTLRGLTT